MKKVKKFSMDMFQGGLYLLNTNLSILKLERITPKSVFMSMMSSNKVPKIDVLLDYEYYQEWVGPKMSIVCMFLHE